MLPLYTIHSTILAPSLAQIAIVGADVQETVGCAQALHILSQSAIPLWAGAGGARGRGWVSDLRGALGGMGRGESGCERPHKSIIIIPRSPAS